FGVKDVLNSGEDDFCVCCPWRRLPTSPVSVDEVGDHSLREQLIKIQEATTVVEANSAIAEAADSLIILGALRHITNLSEKTSLVQSAGEFYVKGIGVQVAKGLQTLGLLEELQKHPVVFYDMFVKDQQPLLAKDLSSSNKRSIENQTICYWRDWLIDFEEGEIESVTLESIMDGVCHRSLHNTATWLPIYS
ncbi:hypothetical protein DNTS_034850, partial [Danionella cerebrum]